MYYFSITILSCACLFFSSKNDKSSSKEDDGSQKQPDQKSQQSPAVLIEDILNNPGRNNRPGKIVVILRGPPGSGKTFVAKLIKVTTLCSCFH